jgi:hypothetical protein
MKRMLIAPLLVLAACAPAVSSGEPSASVSAAAPAAVNPVGTFNYTTAVNNQEVTGTVQVNGQPGAYTGTIRSSITPDVAIAGVTVNGQEMTVTANTMTYGLLTIKMTFTGDTFTGHWSMGGGSALLSGRRAS